MAFDHVRGLTLPQAILLSKIEAAGGRCVVTPLRGAVQISICHAPIAMLQTLERNDFFELPCRVNPVCGCHWAFYPPRPLLDAHFMMVGSRADIPPVQSVPIGTICHTVWDGSFISIGPSWAMMK